MKNEPIIIERIYSATVTKMWKALTGKDQLKDWFFEMDEFKVEKGFEFRFIAYGETLYPHLCKIMEVIPDKKLSYDWRYEGWEGSSLVTFELSDEEGKARMKFTHDGLEAFSYMPYFENKDYAEYFKVAWGKLLDLLEISLTSPKKAVQD